MGERFVEQPIFQHLRVCRDLVENTHKVVHIVTGERLTIRDAFSVELFELDGSAAISVQRFNSRGAVEEEILVAEAVFKQKLALGAGSLHLGLPDADGHLHHVPLAAALTEHEQWECTIACGDAGGKHQFGCYQYARPFWHGQQVRWALPDWYAPCKLTVNQGDSWVWISKGIRHWLDYTLTLWPEDRDCLLTSIEGEMMPKCGQPSGQNAEPMPGSFGGARGQHG